MTNKQVLPGPYLTSLESLFVTSNWDLKLGHFEGPGMVNLFHIKVKLRDTFCTTRSAVIRAFHGSSENTVPLLAKSKLVKTQRSVGCITTFTLGFADEDDCGRRC